MFVLLALLACPQPQPNDTGAAIAPVTDTGAVPPAAGQPSLPPAPR